MDKRSMSSSHSSLKTKSSKPLTTTIDLTATPRDGVVTSRDVNISNLMTK